MIAAFVWFSAISSGTAAISSYLIEGTMAGGPGFRFDTPTTENADDYNPPFSLTLTIDDSQAGPGAFEFTFAQLLIETTSDPSSNADYTATLNNSYTDSITVSGGTKDFLLELKNDHSLASVANPAFFGAEVYGEDMIVTDNPTDGADNGGISERYFMMSLKSNSAVAPGGDALPTSLEPFSQWDKEAKIQIRWRDDTKVSLKGTITGITKLGAAVLPEPSTFVMMITALGTCVMTGWRKRRRPGNIA